MSTDQSIYLKVSLSSYRLLGKFNIGVREEYSLSQQGFRTGVVLNEEKAHYTAQIPQEEIHPLQRWLNNFWQSSAPKRRGEQIACDFLIKELTPYFNPPKTDGEVAEELIHLTYLSDAYCKILEVYIGHDPLRFYPAKSKTTVAVPATEIVPLYQWLEKVFAQGWKDETGRRRGGVTIASQRLLWMLKRHLPLLEPVVLEKMPRPRSVQGHTIEMPTLTYGHLYFTFNWVDGKPFEIFAYIGKNGSDQQATGEGVCRLASLAMRYGIPTEEIIKQLKGIQASSPEWWKGEIIKSLEDAISKALEAGIEMGDPAQNTAI